MVAAVAAALLTLTCGQAPTMATNTPVRYVRIFLPAPVQGSIINLGERSLPMNHSQFCSCL